MATVPFATTILPALDFIRGIRGQLGLNPFTVTVRVRTWNGARVGLGTKTDTDTVLKVGCACSAGLQPVTVKQLSAKDIVSSGGLYTDNDYRVGPLTPDYNTGGRTGGITDTTINPIPTDSPTEVYFKMTGPGLPVAGQWFKRIRDEETALHKYVVIRATAAVP